MRDSSPETTLNDENFPHVMHQISPDYGEES